MSVYVRETERETEGTWSRLQPSVRLSVRLSGHRPWQLYCIVLYFFFFWPDAKDGQCVLALLFSCCCYLLLFVVVFSLAPVSTFLPSLSTLLSCRTRLCIQTSRPHTRTMSSSFFSFFFFPLIFLLPESNSFSFFLRCCLRIG
ncbi:MAG: hypothetical protein J3R72DRAFT_119486 [Linnemannia gamsii]|nr:MAG: hypothetical protein J3R72DRAFT_119486 [Linnemannia gamsii]